jgi:acyl-coenzyme A synthetase/AMP-(fatty) acid ligase
MNKFFLIQEKPYSYDEFVNCINSADGCISRYQETSLFHLYCNFIKALVHNVEVVLIDADIAENELSTLGIIDINTITKVGNDNFKNITEIIERIKESSSKITFFTSGTTGQPKRVTHSTTSLNKNIRQAERYQANIWGLAYNATHIAGIQVFFQALYNENTIVDLFNKRKDYIHNSIDKYQITHLSATPTFYRMMLDENKVFTSIKRVTFGGERSDQRLQARVLKMFPNGSINNIYASTEIGTLLVSKGEYFEIPSNLQPLIKIQDNELIVHNSLIGKFENRIAEDDFFYTGDIVEWVDEDKIKFRFLRRKNELINVGGYNVNPGKIEEIILEIESIENVVVFGKPNSVLGNILCCDIKLVKGAELKEAGVRNYLKDKVQDYNIPRFIKFVDEIETTRTGKAKRS